ncbi:MAG TPA: hypothetical protein VMK12_14165 [Anaeromyxobacteraceae bacterium]|nr:hypothetical protein [Anaeromyxobacteraceae bacterium]
MIQVASVPWPRLRSTSVAGVFCAACIVFLWLGCFDIVGSIDSAERRVVLDAALLTTGALLLATVGLAGDVTQSLHRWLFVVAIFCGYVVQFFWFITDPASAVEATLTVPFGDQDLVRGLWYAAVALASGGLVFALAARVQSWFAAPRAIGTHVGRSAASRVYRTCLCVAALLAPIGLAAAVVFHVGVVGAEEHLPYRLDGVFFYINRAALPGLLLTAVMAATWAEDKKRQTWALALLLVFSVVEAIVTTTRAALVLAGMRYAFVLMLTGAFTRRTMGLMVALTLVAALTFPLMSQLRAERGGGSVSVVEALGEAGAKSEGPGTLMEMVRPFATRFTGLNALAPILRADARLAPGDVLAGFVGGEGPTKYTTHYVFGFDADAPIGIAPSTLGWLYIAGGEWGILWGSAVLALLLEVVWSATRVARLHTRPVLQCLVAGLMFGYLTEGNWEGSGLPILMPVATVAALEFLVRLCMRAEAARPEQPCSS